MSTALVILTLNEIDGVKKILPQIKREWVDEIIVVDGGSTDGTREEVEKMKFNITNQSLKGHGGAIIAGVQATTSDNIMFFGPDGNHEPETIPNLIEKLEEGFDQVINTRFGKTSINDDAGIIDGFGNRMFTKLANLFFGGNLTDTLNEFRIITRKAFKELKFDELSNASTFQISVLGMKRKQKMAEIIGNEGRRIGGKRKMRPIHTGYRCIRIIFRELVRK